MAEDNETNDELNDVLAAADSRYRPFPTLSDWIAHTSIDESRWNTAKELIKSDVNDSAKLNRALDIVRRVAAIETGAIEGLYEVDRGFTITAATQAALLTPTTHGEEDSPRSRLIRSQLAAYEHVLDMATKNVPINQTWIRNIHRLICEAQDTYKVRNAVGTQEVPLPKGAYKTDPNHVVTLNGNVHSYTPVVDTAPEMERLCDILNSNEFERAHPIIQASYAHYAIAAVHPFPDGNGRVARALASTFTTRAASIPLLIESGQRNVYHEALRAADDGEYQRFVDFVMDRAIDACLLVHESLKTAGVPALQESIAALGRLYLTSGGYTHATVDEAGHRLLRLLHDELLSQLGSLAATAMISHQMSLGQQTGLPKVQRGRRFTVGEVQAVTLVMSTKAPAEGRVELRYIATLPIDGSPNDLVTILELTTGGKQVFQTPLRDLIGDSSANVLWRVKMLAEGILGSAIVELENKGREQLKAKGYL